jgi:hypothetical protein
MVTKGIGSEHIDNLYLRLGSITMTGYLATGTCRSLDDTHLDAIALNIVNDSRM